MGSTLCFLVILVSTCVPALAQEGGGTYVQPKHLPQGGTYVEPKSQRFHATTKQGCGGTLTVDADGQTFTSPGYPNNYANRQSCLWQITAMNANDGLKLECSDFNIERSYLCWADRMSLYEGHSAVLRARFCGSGSRSLTIEENTMYVEFLSNWYITRSGFSCKISSVGDTTLTTETSASTMLGMSTETVSMSTNTDITTATEDTTAEVSTASPSTTGSCGCGVANPSRIVGGVEVSPQNKYSWQVGIKSLSSSNYWCGGSIISPSYIMSAAHCFKNQNGVTSASSLLVGVADHNMYSTNDDVSGATRQVPVAQVIVHPQYSSSTSDYDIALLKLKEPLELSKYTQLGAVCLPQDDSSTYAGQTATASGWGTLSSGGQQPSKLQEVSLPILSTSCWGMSGITARMLCAGLKQGGKDTCQGDSGGPLTVQENSIYTQVGITSWGYGCADPNSPGVYARVSKFLSWIETNTAGDLQC